MLKKIIASLAIGCVVVSSFATVSLADSCAIYDEECHNEYNGSYYYDIASCRAYASGRNYTVVVGVKKNGTHYGDRDNTASNGVSTYCWSNQVTGTGGYGAYVAVVV